MCFISNNMTWAASSICDLYRCRWAIETFFKEIKQTLQIKTFLGFNQNAIEWQIWTAMLTYLILRYVAFLSKWKGSFKHLFTLVKGTLWLKRTVQSIVEFYGTAWCQSGRYEPNHLIFFFSKSKIPAFVLQCLSTAF